MIDHSFTSLNPLYPVNWLRVVLAALFIFGLALFLILMFAAGAFAEVDPSATTTAVVAGPSDISLQPLIVQLEPYIIAGLGTIITALVGLAVAFIKQKTGVDIQASQVASLKDAMKTEAASMVAAASDNLAGKTFNVGSPVVAAAVTRVEARIPDLIKATGASPEVLATIMTGELGKLQATMPPPPAEKSPQG